jgi:hypothetical protein
MELLAVDGDNDKPIILSGGRDINDLPGWNRYGKLMVVFQGKDHSREIEAMEHTPSFRECGYVLSRRASTSNGYGFDQGQ